MNCKDLRRHAKGFILFLLLYKYLYQQQHIYIRHIGSSSVLGRQKNQRPTVIYSTPVFRNRDCAGWSRYIHSFLKIHRCTAIYLSYRPDAPTKLHVVRSTIYIITIYILFRAPPPSRSLSSFTYVPVHIKLLFIIYCSVCSHKSIYYITHHHTYTPSTSISVVRRWRLFMFHIL